MPKQRKRPELNFVFAEHTGNRTARVLKSVIKHLKRRKRNIPFLGIELNPVRASRKIELERTRNWRNDEHSTNILRLADKHKVPIRLLEAARPKQHKKVRRLANRRFARGFPTYFYDMDFKTGMNYTTDNFYRSFGKHMSRHEEVLRNLRKETRTMQPNDSGIIIFGEFHKGLDRFIADRTGIKTIRNSEKEHYKPIEAEVMEKCFANPTKRKPSRTEMAQILLEKLFSIDTLGHGYEKHMIKKKPAIKIRIIFRNLNAIKRLIKKLTFEEIQAHWERLRNHKLARLSTIRETGNRMGEIKKLVKVVKNQ